MNDLTSDEKHLARFMSDLSERCYCAGWIMNLEYVLWDAVQSGPRKFGQDLITKEVITRLIHYSNKAGSWVVNHDDGEETAIPLEIWKRTFSEETGKNPDLLRG